jgi:hypothetical protein
MITLNKTDVVPVMLSIGHGSCHMIVGTSSMFGRRGGGAYRASRRHGTLKHSKARSLAPTSSVVRHDPVPTPQS